MRDDEKMFNIGVIMSAGMVLIIILLQVCYRIQNNELSHIRKEIKNTAEQYGIAETRFSALSSADSLRNSVKSVYPKAETVSFSKTIQINDVAMVE